MIQSMIQEIAIRWHLKDVQSVRPDLSDEQASIVLNRLENNHDATIGINWEVIEIVADIQYPSAEVTEYDLSDEEEVR